MYKIIKIYSIMYIGMIDMEIKGKYKVKIINQNSDGLESLG